MVHQAAEREGDTDLSWKHGLGPCADVQKGDNWNDLLKEVVTFDSVEEFWGVYVGLRTSFDILL